MPGDQAAGQRRRFPGLLVRGQLQQQTLAGVGRAQTRRPDRTQDGDHPLDPFPGHPERPGHAVRAALEEAAPVEVGQDPRGQRPVRLVELGGGVRQHRGIDHRCRVGDVE